MRIHRLVLHNYRRHRQVAIELPDGLISLVGRNGSGKSSLLEAIAFALYGTAATRTAKDLLRSEHAAPGDDVRVEVEAEVDGQAWRVMRQLRGKNLSASALLEVDGHTVVAPQAGSSEAVTQEVESRIGLSREAFFTTVFSEQKQLGRLAQQKPADRKRLILSMMGVDALDQAIQAGRRSRNEANIRLETLLRDMPDMAILRQEAASAGQLELQARQQVAAAAEGWKNAHDAWQARQAEFDQARQAHEARREAQQATQAARTQRDHLQQAAMDLAKRAGDALQARQEAQALAQAPAQMAQARKALEDAKDAARQVRRGQELDARMASLRRELAKLAVPGPNGLLEEAKQEVVGLRKRREEASGVLAVASARARQCQERLESVSGLEAAADCPVCQRPLQDHLPHLHSQYVEELQRQRELERTGKAKLSKIDAALGQAEARMQEMEAQARRHQQAMIACKRIEGELAEAAKERQALPDAAPDLDPLQQRLAHAEQQEQQRVRLSALAEDADDLHRKHQDAEARCAAATAALIAAEAALEEMPETAPRMAASQQSCQEAADLERQAERSLQGARTALASASARRDAANVRLQDATNRLERLEEVRDELEHWELLAGPRGGLLDRFRSHLVGRIGPAVSTEASRLLSRFTGGRYNELVLDDEYRIFVGDNGVLYDISRFSGGETDLVHLALRLAVSRLLLERAGVEIRLLALDEVFGSLDDERRLLVLGALQELGGMYSQVFVVSHHDALREALDHAIVVEEKDGEAHIRMHNG